MEQAILRGNRSAPQSAEEKNFAAPHNTAPHNVARLSDAAAAERRLREAMPSAGVAAVRIAGADAATVASRHTPRGAVPKATAINIDKYKLTLIPSVLGALALLTALSVLLVDTNADWYLRLLKPPFTPSGGAVKGVFVFLYILTALAYLTACGKKFNAEITKFLALCLSLNVVWFLSFFALRLRFISFIIIIVNLTLCLLALYKLHHFNRKSGYMLVPYFIWMCFILTLNYAILMLN
jgi:tryptophan-rich sensory protein